MTLGEARTCLSKLSFRGPLPISFTIERVSARADVELVAILSTQDRDDLSKTKVYSVEIVPDEILESLSENTFKHLVVKHARKLWTHEFDEWMRYEGDLVNDVHATD